MGARAPVIALLAACAHHVPVVPLGPEPPLAAPDYATVAEDPSSGFARQLLAGLQGVAPDTQADQRLNRVASWLAWRVAAGEPPSTLPQIHDRCADAGSPYLVSAAFSVRVPRDLVPGEDVLRPLVDGVAGAGLPLVVGVGAVDLDRETHLVVVFTRRSVALPEPVARVASGPIRVEPLTGLPKVELLGVDAAGVHDVVGEAGSPLAPPVTDGWVDVLARTGSGRDLVGRLRFGTPPPLPVDAAAADPLEASVHALRAAWGLPPLRRLPSDPVCDGFPDALDGAEVTRDQRCVATIGGDDPVRALAQSPMLLEALDDPRPGVFQLGVDERLVSVRAAASFERLTDAEVTERLAAQLQARFPKAERSAASAPFSALAAAWGHAPTPLATLDVWRPRADAAAGAWVKSGKWMQVTGASAYPESVLSALPATVTATEFVVGAALGVGDGGEPLYFGIAALRLE